MRTVEPGTGDGRDGHPNERSRPALAGRADLSPRDECISPR
jgi:hypothetical protein